jgi:hypothetical protein
MFEPVVPTENPVVSDRATAQNLHDTELE